MTQITPIVGPKFVRFVLFVSDFEFTEMIQLLIRGSQANDAGNFGFRLESKYPENQLPHCLFQLIGCVRKQVCSNDFSRLQPPSRLPLKRLLQTKCQKLVKNEPLQYLTFSKRSQNLINNLVYALDISFHHQFGIFWLFIR